MKIHGAIFDMDGTLIDSLFYWKEYWRDFAEKYGFGKEFSVSPQFDARVRTMIYSEVIKEIYKEYKPNTSLADFTQYSLRYLDVFYETRTYVKDGVIEFLDSLKQCGIPMCVASATGQKHVLAVLKHLGLIDYFDFVVSCVDLGVDKSMPDVYELAAKRLGLAPDQTCVFEDSYVALETAKRLGCHTVGVFDPNNYSQDRLCRAAEIYIADGASMADLIGVIH